MKKTNHIEELIAQGEHQQLDFKFEVSDSKKIARTLSAFANTDGGTLLIGVKDNGKIAGVRSEEEFYMIEAASTVYTRPCVPFSAKRWEIEGKTVLEVYIAPSETKPHTAPDKDDKYKAYIRVDDENMLANGVLTLAWKKKERKSGLLLPISQPVKKLMQYLDGNQWITINQFCRIANINYYTARNILSSLMAFNTLNYSVINKRVFYRLTLLSG
jgi:predicted HTH transcriptional regulator